MRALYLMSVWLHILAAVTWIGGMLFLVLVLIPIIRRPEHRGIAAPLVHLTGVRFRQVGWASLGLLILSGIINLAYRGYGWDDLLNGTLVQGPFGRILGIKLFMVATILVVSAVHDFVVGPRASTVLRANPSSPDALRLRRRAGWLGRTNLILAAIVVALGVMLVRGGA